MGHDVDTMRKRLFYPSRLAAAPTHARERREGRMLGADMSTPAELARQVEQLDDEDWYDFLDELDEVSRRRRQREPESPDPAGTSRDEVAAWVAK